ncbi:MAG: ExbD/TolR family protein [Chitinophagaceae bacterium]
MAEMEVKSGEAGKHGGTKSKKQSTRIDLTPMVDLGFLLITFFMLTTTLQKPKTMNLYLPKDTKNKDQQNKVKESQALTILLGKDNEIFYYEGIGSDPAHPPVLVKSSFANKGGIRDEIINKWASVIQKSGGQDSMVVIIKPDSVATYESVVNVLDEMTINGVKKYALVDISPIEMGLLEKQQ